MSEGPVFILTIHVSIVILHMHMYTVSVQGEIEDRQKFLADMEAMGKGEKYRQIIATEISQVSCVPFSCLLQERFSIVLADSFSSF